MTATYVSVAIDFKSKDIYGTPVAVTCSKIFLKRLPELWASLTSSQRSTIKSQYVAAGIKLIVSLFGSTDAPTSSGADPVATANTMAAWVKQYDLDGVDVDYEVSFLRLLICVVNVSHRILTQ